MEEDEEEDLVPQITQEHFEEASIVLGPTKTSGVTRCLRRSVQIYSGFPFFADFFCVNYRFFSRRVGLGIISRSLREVVQRRLAMQDWKKRQPMTICMPESYIFSTLSTMPS